MAYCPLAKYTILVVQGCCQLRAQTIPCEINGAKASCLGRQLQLPEAVITTFLNLGRLLTIIVVRRLECVINHIDIRVAACV